MTWLKVEAHTPDKPEIRQIARLCGCTPAEAFAAWFRLWAWFDGLTEDGSIPFLTRRDCDDRAGLPRIGEALEAVGWMEFWEGRAAVIGWETHNGASAKARAMAAKRKQRERERTGAESGYRPWHA